MTDSKKRIIKILNNFGIDLDLEDISSEILKEFVHKDNLPSEKETRKMVSTSHAIHLVDGEWGESDEEIDELVEGFQKLIEGRENV